MRFIKREIEPHKLNIGGAEYPAIYSFAAIKEQENYTGYPHTVTTTRIANNTFSAKDIIGVVYGMLKAAGVECTPEDIEQSVIFDDETKLVSAVIDIMNAQMPPLSEDEPIKKAGRAAESNGTT